MKPIKGRTQWEGRVDSSREAECRREKRKIKENREK